MTNKLRDLHLTIILVQIMCKGVLDATLCDKELSVTCSMSMDSPISSTNKTDCHYITEILLKVTLLDAAQTLTLLHSL